MSPRAVFRTPEQVEDLHSMLHLTIGQIAVLHDCSTRTVERALARHGLREAHRVARAQHIAETRAHGTRNSYNYGCRCPDCRAVTAAAKRDWLARTRRSA